MPPESPIFVPYKNPDMKRILILLAAVCCTLPMAAQWGRRPTPNDTLQSTRVLPDGKVLFQI